MEEYHRGGTRKDIPYYPIPGKLILAIFAKYKQLSKEYPDYFVWHLADYRYYDMNIAVQMALDKFEHEINL